MLTQLGKRSGATSPGKLLTECHGRIRHFLSLAVRLTSSSEAPEADIVDAAKRIDRYFREAYPLHVRDEEESLVPRLLNVGATDALKVMQREHVSLEARIVSLRTALANVIACPTSAAFLEPLSAIANELSIAMETHLAGEESVVIPAVDSLSAEEQSALLAEFRARRTHA